MIDIDSKELNRILQSPEFTEEFWNWFDTLSQKEKNVFLYYKDDMAKIFFYNKYYRHRVKNNEESGYLTIRT